RWQHPEDVVGGGELALEPVRPGPPGHSGLSGVDQDLVIDVGDVAHHGDVQTGPAQPAHQDVEGDRGAQVPDVRGPLHSGATQVDAHVPRGAGNEVVDLTGGGIMQANTHPAEFTGAGVGQPPRRCTTRSGRSRRITRWPSVPSSAVQGWPVCFWLGAWISAPAGSSSMVTVPRTSTYSCGLSAG